MRQQSLAQVRNNYSPHSNQGNVNYVSEQGWPGLYKLTPTTLKTCSQQIRFWAHFYRHAAEASDIQVACFTP